MTPYRIAPKPGQNHLPILLLLRKSKDMPYFFVAFLLLVLSACGKGPSAETYAKQFCRCATPIVEAKIQLESKRIPAAVFEQVERDGRLCLDKDNPLSQINNAQDSAKFMLEFTRMLFLECPETARGMDFKAPF